MRPEWKEPIAVLGYGVEGKSTLRHLLRWGYRKIVVLDGAKPSDALPAGVQGFFGPDYLRGLTGVKTAIRSPGLRPFIPEIEAFIESGGLLTSQVEAVFSILGPKRIIAVTGTVGKGTCCSLLSAMLEKGNLPHQLAGNIGVPSLDALESLREEEILLLELSSFQLSTLAQSPGIAIVLRTTIEHLDWHDSQQEYWNHKANLTRHQRAGDICIFFADAVGSAWIGSLGSGEKIPVGRTGMMRISEETLEWPEHGFRLRLDETKMPGAFNLENIGAAAAAALLLGVSPEAVRSAACDFAPLEHRLEFVRKVGEVAYYNDSYATRPEASLAAVRAMRGQPLGLILGGSEKFADFTEFATELASEQHLRAIALIGQTAQRLEGELKTAGALKDRTYRVCGSLEEAVEFLKAEISSGVILLSPACASFGLFANYKERGYAFKRLVSQIMAISAFPESRAKKSAVFPAAPPHPIRPAST